MEPEAGAESGSGAICGRYVFERAPDPERGGEGWRPTWLPNGYAAAGPGAMVAHDVIEHLNPFDGTVANELHALGAALYIRGRGGCFAMLGAEWSRVVADDLALLFRDVQDPALEPAQWPASAPRLHVRQLDAESELQVAKGLDLAAAWLIDGGEDPGEVVRRYRGRGGAILSAHLRAGFRQARRVYRAHAPLEVALVFCDLTKAAHERLDERPGEPLRLVVDFDRRALAWSLEAWPT